MNKKQVRSPKSEVRKNWWVLRYFGLRTFDFGLSSYSSLLFGSYQILTRFSGSMAFGLEIPMGARAAVRLEARGYLTAVDTDTSFFCRSDDGEGAYKIIASGSAILQTEALAGILVRF